MNTTRDAILSLIARDEGYYRPILEEARKRFSVLKNGFHDDAAWLSGWAHNFNCEDCGTQLLFDSSLAHGDPYAASFSCPNCGKIMQGQKYAEAWVYYNRTKAAADLESAAVCALLGDVSAENFIADFIDFYAKHYESFPIHGLSGGKITGQILDESVFCLFTLRALYPCLCFYTDTKKRFWYEKLFSPMVALIDGARENTLIHNHVLWNKCAVAAVGLCFGDEALYSHAMNDEYGVRHQLKEGLTADGLWYECCTTYHYYAMNAVSELCALLADAHPTDPLLPLLAKACEMPFTLSRDGLHFPTLNDGWYPVAYDGQHARTVHVAWATSPTAELERQISTIRSHTPAVFAKPYALLLDGKAPPVPARATSQADGAPLVYPSCKLAVMRAPFHAILKSGVINDIHKHADCLSVVISPFSDDLGTVGYGNPLYRSWYATAASHTTVTVDGTQGESIDTVFPNRVEAVKDGVRATVEAWPHVLSATRTLTTEGEALVDTTEILCEEEGHTVDWLFHSKGEWTANAALGEAVTLGEENGYQHLKDAKRLVTDGPLSLSFTLEGETLTLTANTERMEAYIAKSPDNPADRYRTVLILRSHAKNNRFTVKYTR